MSNSSKQTKGGDGGSVKNARERLEAEVGELTQQNTELNARLLEVEKKLGRITQKPTAADRFKKAMLPKRFDPLSKLSSERDQILGALRTNRESREKATAQVDLLIKVEEQAKKEVRFEAAVEKRTVGDALRQKTAASKSTQTISSELPGSESNPVENAPGRSSELRENVVGGPLRSDLGSGAYATHLQGDELEEVESEGLRSDLGSGAYATHLQGDELEEVESEGLRSDLGSGAYATHLQGDELEEVGSEGLRSDLGSGAYATHLQGDDLEEVESEGLRGPDMNSAYDLRGEVSEEEGLDSLRSDEPHVGEEDLLRTESVNAYDAVDTDGLDELGVSSDDELVMNRSEAVSNEETGRKFKMKSLEDEFVEAEKLAPKTQVKVNGKEVMVHEKEWLRGRTNAERREKKLPEFSKEIWEKSGIAGLQPRTQYFDEAQQKESQIKIEEGVLKAESGILKEGNHIFVMDGEGQVYAEDQNASLKHTDDSGRIAHVHHSSLLAGEDVAGAGNIRVGKDGTLKEMDDRSGHYRPGEEQTKQTLEQIEELGVSLDNVQFTMDRGEVRTKGMAREFLQGQVTPEEMQHRAAKESTGQTVRNQDKVMENTFKGRHNVADEIKGKGESVRDSLRKTDNLEKIESEAPKKGLGRVR